MIVSTCSYGSTGSSAVSDYLKECENTQVFDKLEFTLTSRTDGLSDLEYYLMKKNARQSASITAIQRFQKGIDNQSKVWCKSTGISKEQIRDYTDEFLDGITQVKYIGPSPRIYKGGSAFLNKKIGNAILLRRIVRPLEQKGMIRNYAGYPFGEVRISVHPDNFYELAKTYVSNILSGFGADFRKTIVLDQAFSGTDPIGSFPFFDDPYAVVVDRDPRDIYIFAKEVLKSRGRFMPTDRVEDFIVYYKVLRASRAQWLGNPRCLFMQFEEMVYNYESAVSRIDEFLHVINNHRKMVFDPAISVANTNLPRKFPQYAQDIKKIEQTLPEYCFDFGKYSEMDNSGKMFFGKSPLNK